MSALPMALARVDAAIAEVEAALAALPAEIPTTEARLAAVLWGSDVRRSRERYQLILDGLRTARDRIEEWG